MNPDVMKRLLSIEPLPRGERIVRIFESLDTRDNISHYPGRNYLEASHLGVLDDIFLIYGNTSLAVQFTREWAAPLRRCREENIRLRESVKSLQQKIERLTIQIDNQNKNLARMSGERAEARADAKYDREYIRSELEYKSVGDDNDF